MASIDTLAAPLVAVGLEHGVDFRRESVRSRFFKPSMAGRKWPNITLEFTAKTRTVRISYSIVLLACGSGVEPVRQWDARPAAFTARPRTDIYENAVWRYEDGVYTGPADTAAGPLRELLEGLLDE